jgi:hypothetical protein
MRLAILLVTLPFFAVCCLAVCGDSASASEPVATVARFAVIYPEADLAENADDADPPKANPVRLPRPVRKPSQTDRAASKQRKAVEAKPERTPASVTPLRRDRPKNEVDPPKTRRRSLGW